MGKRPVLLLNVASSWQASHRWTKQGLWDALPEAAEVTHLQTDDFHASFNIYHQSDLREFLCHGVCAEPVDDDQRYVFDRDKWLTRLPGLVNDTELLSLVESHFDPLFHERWSRYFLVAARGSGINHHAHTNAFQAQIFGEKRWFMYPPNITPPSYQIGAAQWFRRVYKDSWAKGDGVAGKDGLLQCMQPAGSVMYVPQFWHHSTLSLGEGVGISGQFVRRTHELLQSAFEHFSNRDFVTAERLYTLVKSHQDEVEGGIIGPLLVNLAACKFHLKKYSAARNQARDALDNYRLTTVASSTAQRILDALSSRNGDL